MAYISQLKPLKTCQNFKPLCTFVPLDRRGEKIL